MTTMDVKSMSWVDDMYQKFEAMCAEVEETMYQESVKYVENQVKTVGECVKRFCADVIQDLVPLSSDDPLKPENTHPNSVQYADDSICEKSDVYAKKERLKPESEHLSLSGDSYLASQSDQIVDSRLSSGSYDSSSQYKLPTDEFTAVKCPGLHVQKSGTEELFLCSNDESEVKFLPSEISSPENVDPQSAFLSNGRESTTELEKMSDGIKGTVECTSVTTSSSNPAVDEFGDDEDTLKMSDGQHFSFPAGSYEPEGDEIESDDLEKEAFQVSEHIGKLKLDESCVLVDKYEHFSVPHSKERSYKKKIKDVLYLRRWSRSKNPEEPDLNVLLQEEMNSTNHGSKEITASNYALESGNLNLESNSLESGWEIL